MVLSLYEKATKAYYSHDRRRHFEARCPKIYKSNTLLMRIARVKGRVLSVLRCPPADKAAWTDRHSVAGVTIHNAAVCELLSVAWGEHLRKKERSSFCSVSRMLTMVEKPFYRRTWTLIKESPERGKMFRALFDVKSLAISSLVLRTERE